MNAMDQKTPAYRLFHRRYLFHIPRVFQYGSKFMDRVGVASTGDSQLDVQRLAVTEPMKKTVAGMALLHYNGAPVGLVNKKDSTAIFRDIQDHLNDWRRAIENGIYYEYIPDIEEFRALEAIAVAVYPVMMRLKPTEQNDGKLKRRLEEMQARRFGGYRTTTAKKQEPEIKPYISVVDDIEEMMAGHMSWR